jgi:hypothetical protein
MSLQAYRHENALKYMHEQQDTLTGTWKEKRLGGPYAYRHMDISANIFTCKESDRYLAGHLSARRPSSCSQELCFSLGWFFATHSDAFYYERMRAARLGMKLVDTKGGESAFSAMTFTKRSAHFSFIILTIV